MRWGTFLLLALALCAACFGLGDETPLSPAAPPVCEPGCVAQPCEMFFAPEGPRPAGPDAYLAWVEPCQEVDETDAAGNPTVMSCYADRNVELEWRDGLLVRGVYDQRHPEELTLIETTFEYDEDGRFVRREEVVTVDGAEKLRVSWEYEYDGDAVVIERFRRRYEERFDFNIGGQPTGEEAGWHSDPRFTDDAIERTLEVRTYDATGRPLAYEQRGGLAEVFVESVTWRWGEEGRLLAESYERVEGDPQESEPPSGCEALAEGRYRCTTAYEHDDAGEVSAWVRPDGERVTASDSCCVPGCVGEDAASDEVE